MRLFPMRLFPMRLFPMRPFPQRHSFALTMIAALLCGPALAQTPMTAAEFDAYATGKTLTFARDGAVWGTEQYLKDRRVLWAFTEEECRSGYWYARAQEICFVYEDRADPQCWLFYRGATGLSAQYVGDDAGAPLAEVAQSTGPLGCAGPDLGV